MKIKQVINNNVVSTLVDDEEVIVFGKGIGFEGKVGEEIDSNRIEKTYVLIDPAEENQMKLLIQEIPYDVIKFGLKATEYISDHLSKTISKRILIPLTDHIYACLSRYKEKGKYEIPLSMNVSYLYKEEYEIATEIVKMMNEEFQVDVGQNEATFITLHIVNSELDVDLQDTYRVMEIINLSVSTVEEFFNVKLDNTNLHFARFLTHLQFFAQRMIKNTMLEDEADDIINKHINLRYPKAYACAKEIGKKIHDQYGWDIDANEYMYLTIHIARLLK